MWAIYSTSSRPMRACREHLIFLHNFLTISSVPPLFTFFLSFKTTPYLYLLQVFGLSLLSPHLLAHPHTLFCSPTTFSFSLLSLLPFHLLKSLQPAYLCLTENKAWKAQRQCYGCLAIPKATNISVSTIVTSGEELIASLFKFSDYSDNLGVLLSL